MSVTWRGVPSPAPRSLAPAGLARVAWRLPAFLAASLGAFAVFLAARGAERLAGRAGWSRKVKHAGFRATLAILGVALRRTGAPLRGGGALVANHAGWLDVWALGASCEVTFVSKAEVRRWPLLGHMAAAAGTVFITRRRGDAAAQQAALARRLGMGDTLAFFPEGTSTDGRRVLPFRSTLFATLLGPGLEGARVQPVTLAYRAPEGERADLHGWWGDMALLPHVLEVMAAPPGGEVQVTFHPPIAVRDIPDRKALARRCEAQVREGLHTRLSAAGAPSAAAR